MATRTKKNPAAVALGRKGGKARTDAKADAARANGAKGGRPKKVAKRVAKALVLLCAAWPLVACGSSAPSLGPSPTPIASAITVTGTLTDTVSGTVIGSFTQSVDRLPALVPVRAADHLERTARITSATPTVDLIPETGIDLAFYRQLVRGALDGRMDPVRRWTESPRIYLQRTGLSAGTIAALEQTARAVIPAWTGERLTLAGWETGDAPRPEAAGWIVVSTLDDPAPYCGQTTVGGGAITLNTKPNCVEAGYAATNFAHELGHALGFWHVDRADAVMHAPAPRGVTGPSLAERAHAAIAYARAPGNRDVDVDSLSGSLMGVQRVID